MRLSSAAAFLSSLLFFLTSILCQTDCPTRNGAIRLDFQTPITINCVTEYSHSRVTRTDAAFYSLVIPRHSLVNALLADLPAFRCLCFRMARTEAAGNQIVASLYSIVKAQLAQHAWKHGIFVAMPNTVAFGL